MIPQASTTEKPARVPLVTTFTNRDESFNRDSRLVNCIAEKDLVTDEYWVEKRPGYGSYPSGPFSGPGLGVCNWLGDVYAIFGDTIYKNGTSFATIDGSNGPYRFVQLRGSPETLVFGNGVIAYYTDGSSVIQIPLFAPVTAGSFEAGSSYTILSQGTTDYTQCGAGSNPTGTTKIYAGSFVPGNTYVIQSMGSIVVKWGVGVKKDYRTDFVYSGAANNHPGTVFVATNAGDPYRTPSGLTPPNGATTTGYAYDGPYIGAGTTFTATNEGSGTGTCALNATSLKSGYTYMILNAGTTDFTLVGASANTPGTVFTASGPGTGTGTVYVQTSFPSEFCRGWAYLDGTLYVMNLDGAIYGSLNLDDPSQWDPLNKIYARVEPDRGVALAKQLVYVIALKEWTTEVFYDAGNPSPGSPLSPVLGAKAPYGCVSADSVQEIDDKLMWVSSNRTASPQIVLMEDLKVRVVSTPAIERVLDQADFSVGVLSWRIKHGGHRFYGVTIKDKNVTFVYDLDQNLWYQWTDENGNYWKIAGETFDDTPAHVVQHESNGHLYTLEGDYEYPSDDGVVVPVDIITINADMGIDRRKVLNMMRFNADQHDGSILYVRVSDDDYQTWSQWREVDLGHKRPILTKCGTFYRRAWWFRHYANTPFRIKTVDLQLDFGKL